ncbi:MAG: hypothetical protein AAGG01_12800, partial [Planctomycetota bacterium]
TAASTAVEPGSVAVETTSTASTGTEPSDSEAVDATYDRSDADFSAEIPDDALAYFEFESLAALEEMTLRISTLVDTKGLDILNPASATLPIAAAGVDLALIDRHAPMAVAYVQVPGELFPSPMFFAPAVTDEPLVESYVALATRGLHLRRTEGGYAIIEPAALSDSTPRGGSDLAENLPDSCFRGRFHTKTFLPSLNLSLEPLADALNEAYRLSRPKVSAGDLYEFTPQSFTDAVSSAQDVGFGVDLDGDRAVVSLDLRGCRKDSYGSGSVSEEVQVTLNELSHHIDTEGPASFITAFDPETAVSTLRNLWENREDWSHVGRTPPLR